MTTLQWQYLPTEQKTHCRVARTAHTVQPRCAADTWKIFERATHAQQTLVKFLPFNSEPSEFTRQTLVRFHEKCQNTARHTLVKFSRLNLTAHQAAHILVKVLPPDSTDYDSDDRALPVKHQTKDTNGTDTLPCPLAHTGHLQMSGQSIPACFRHKTTKGVLRVGIKHVQQLNCGLRSTHKLLCTHTCTNTMGYWSRQLLRHLSDATTSKQLHTKTSTWSRRENQCVHTRSS